MGIRNAGLAGIASLFLVTAARADLITTISSAPVAPVGAASGGGLNGSLYLANPINFAFASGSGGADSTDGLSTAQSYISGHTPTATYNATALNYSGKDSTAANAELGADSNGTAAGITTHINSSIFDANGYVTIPTAGTYTFGVSNSDDGSFVLIGGQTVAADGGSHGGQNASGNVTFNAAGVYPIEVLYFNQQYQGDANNDGSGGATFTFNNAAGVTLNSSVPEPTTLSLLGLGGLSLLARRRR